MSENKQPSLSKRQHNLQLRKERQKQDEALRKEIIEEMHKIVISEEATPGEKLEAVNNIMKLKCIR